MKTLIVLPTFNEAENLPLLVDQILSLNGQDISLLVVDDSSPDGTGRIADRLSEEHPGKVFVMHRKGKQGLASAYIQGFKRALQIDEVEAIGMMDSDFSHDPAVLPEMIAALQGADLVIGSRYVEGGSVDEVWPAWRKFLSAFGNFYARTILNLDTQDVTTGYRLWRKEKMQTFPLDAVLSTGYIFLVEMAFLATRLGFRIVEVPIYFADRKLGESKMNLRIQLEAAYRVWQVRFAHKNRFSN
ncbi:MAG: polyprenol monophosphomannose synthase [Anaerolineales bacterium]|nr:polyprenol monophosphomannose synthase [Anaerolineales bacterium]